MTNYDNDPRYDFVEDGVYFDTQTNETVFVLDEETSDAIRDLMALDSTLFEVNEDKEEIILTEEGAKKLFGHLKDDTQIDGALES